MDKKTKRNKAEKLQSIIGGLILSLVVFGLAIVFLVSPQTTAEHASEINFTQVIGHNQEVSAVGDLEVTDTAPVPEKEFTVATSTDTGPVPLNIPSIGPVNRFYGTVAHAQAPIFIELRSDTIIRGSAQSDQFGAWQWTNYGAPLTEGEHTAYIHVWDTNTDTVYVTAYVFTVSAVKITTEPTDLDIDQLTPDPEKIASSSVESSYHPAAEDPLLHIEVNFTDQPIRYQRGETLRVATTISPVNASTVPDAVLQYKIFPEGELVDSAADFMYEEPISILGSTEYFQPMQLSKNISPGNYVFSAQVVTDPAVYISNKRLVIETPTLVTVGSSHVDLYDANKVFWRNVILFMMVAIIILALAANEYRRFFVQQPISEDELRARGYIRPRQSNIKKK